MNPIAPEGPWSLGTLIWLPIAAVIVLVCVGLAWAGIRYALKADGYDDPVEGFALAVCAAVTALTIAGGTGFGMWPYDSEYHQWRTVSGEVEQVSKRLVGSGDSGMSERFVVVIAGQPFGVDDTRASLIEVGQDVTLSCKREWQYAAQSGWGCRWNGVAR